MNIGSNGKQAVFERHRAIIASDPHGYEITAFEHGGQFNRIEI